MKIRILFCKVRHLFRWFFQFFLPADVAIVGGYHYSNLGDMVLGRTFASLLKSHNLIPALQTIYKIEKWRKFKVVLVGGGAVGYPENINKIINYGLTPDSVFFCGVDFNGIAYSEKQKEFLCQAKVFVRSKPQHQKLLSELQVINCSLAPDPSFAYKILKFREIRHSSLVGKPVLWINAFPLFSLLVNGKLVPINNYKEENIEVYANHNLVLTNYAKLILSVIMHFKGSVVVKTLPFTFQDESYLKILLKEEVVEQTPYSSALFTQDNFPLKPNDYVFCTRLHATILAARSGCKLIPFSYNEKNDEVLESLGFLKNQYFSLQDLLKPDFQVQINATKPLESKVMELENSCLQVYSNLINSIR